MKLDKSWLQQRVLITQIAFKSGQLQCMQQRVQQLQKQNKRLTWFNLLLAGLLVLNMVLHGFGG